MLAWFFSNTTFSKNEHGDTAIKRVNSQTLVYKYLLNLTVSEEICVTLIGRMHYIDRMLEIQ